eukprot:CAMPEP_0201520738 /NCGR_PEP_ID=MMETSP0161_2-20130828/12438_1 /ASSEMBLY_ACC=CAM_ASM_000251 /TAXON_ID=180227 /ORGANISM="Neoparamoeba aestuarina, Strain SoJaBio B1-5/56/2" /LENGTH=287 /DNA_ID=CAMNT_0047919217 /DNA_START=45 /DNA_END=908 /DNA_ORIENTATION=+
MALLRFLFVALLLSFATFVFSQDEEGLHVNVDNFYEDDEGERKYDAYDQYERYDPDLEAKIQAALDNYETFDVEAEEEDEDEDENRFFYEPASQISSHFLFPQSVESNVIFLGEENELLVAFKNNYPVEINITAIRLSIMHPMEPSHYYLQNCTPEFYYQTIAPETTKTFHYEFVPDAMLQPRAYVVVTNVYFEAADGKHYIFQALNATHDFDDAPAKLDTQILFMVFSIIGIFAFAVYMVFSSLKSGKRRGPAPKSNTVVGDGEVKDEWLSHLNQGKKKQGGKKRN